MELSGHAEDAVSATERCALLRPDVILLDLSLAPSDGVEIVHNLHRRLPEARLVALSDDADGAFARSVLEAGAAGYALRGTDAGEMARGLDQIRLGKVFVGSGVGGGEGGEDGGLRDYLRDRLAGGYRRGLKRLTRREREVFHLCVEGRRNKDIAAALFVSIKTVEKHKSNLFRKLGVTGAEELRTLWRRGAFGP